MFDRLVAVRGGGDLGSGAALRLWRAGFSVVILETECPIAVRRTVSFSEAVYDGKARVEEADALLVYSLGDVRDVLTRRNIAVMVDPAASSLQELRPYALVDAIMAKRNIGTTINMARCVVALGPGFTSGVDVHAVVETNRGPDLGRVLWRGQAEPNSGTPGPVMGRTAERVLRAPVSGIFRAQRAIGDVVAEGDVLARVGGEPIRASFPALIRGLVRDRMAVQVEWKVGDIDPRLDPRLCQLVSDKALAIAGGVLEAILVSLREGMV